MSKKIVICRHGQYDPGRRHLNTSGQRQIAMVIAAVFAERPLENACVFHSDGPRSTHSAIVAVKTLRGAASFGGLLTLSDPADLASRHEGDCIYFSSGEEMNRILPILLSSYQECGDYRKVKGRLYAEILEIGSDGVWKRVHYLEIE